MTWDGRPFTSKPSKIERSHRWWCVSFEIDPFRKRCLLEGLDETGLTLEKATAIDDFEQSRRASQPWL